MFSAKRVKCVEASADQNLSILHIFHVDLLCISKVVHPWCAADQPQSTSSVASWQPATSTRQCTVHWQAVADERGNILPEWAIFCQSGNLLQRTLWAS